MKTVQAIQCCFNVVFSIESWEANTSEVNIIAFFRNHRVTASFQSHHYSQLYQDRIFYILSQCYEFTNLKEFHWLVQFSKKRKYWSTGSNTYKYIVSCCIWLLYTTNTHMKKIVIVYVWMVLYDENHIFNSHNNQC